MLCEMLRIANVKVIASNINIKLTLSISRAKYDIIFIFLINLVKRDFQFFIEKIGNEKFHTKLPIQK
ncbi:hypothetical protein BpHYR1_049556 [Brachionus plicatilis]|uniref:Uncharacterized protein n=1 Tax=Brachionus plicatilis TaxID=10195 RepID=A0A3M7SBC5_BRAPC|nr:hypothetical protein BpHYR1_049556 [Brachionus plicatilis]